MVIDILVKKIGDDFRIVIRTNKIYVDENLSGYTFLYIDRNTGEVRGFRGRTGTSEFVPLPEALKIVKRTLLKLV